MDELARDRVVGEDGLVVEASLWAPKIAMGIPAMGLGPFFCSSATGRETAGAKPKTWLTATPVLKAKKASPDSAAE